jgi:hypothetical protein
MMENVPLHWNLFIFQRGDIGITGWFSPLYGNDSHIKLSGCVPNSVARRGYARALILGQVVIHRRFRIGLWARSLP